MKKKGRGPVDYRREAKLGLAIAWWQDTHVSTVVHAAYSQQRYTHPRV